MWTSYVGGPCPWLSVILGKKQPALNWIKHLSTRKAGKYIFSWRQTFSVLLMKAWVWLRHCQLRGDQRKGPWSKIWHFRILRQASAGATFQGHQVQILQVHGGQGNHHDRGEGGWDLRGGGGGIEGRDETKIQSQSLPQICDFEKYFKNI